MGKGDKKTVRGKIWNGSYGKKRKKKLKPEFKIVEKPVKKAEPVKAEAKKEEKPKAEPKKAAPKKPAAKKTTAKKETAEEKK